MSSSDCSEWRAILSQRRPRRHLRLKAGCHAGSLRLPPKISKTTPCKVAVGRRNRRFEPYLTRRANQQHCFIIARFVRWPRQKSVGGQGLGDKIHRLKPLKQGKATRGCVKPEGIPTPHLENRLDMSVRRRVHPMVAGKALRVECRPQVPRKDAWA